MKTRKKSISNPERPFLVHFNRACMVHFNRACMFNDVQVNLFQKHLFLPQLLNPQYDKRLFIESPVHKSVQENSKLRTCCVLKIVLNIKTKTKKQFVYTTCSELGIFMYWTGDSKNNLLSYCGLVDAKIRASVNHLPVLTDWRQTCYVCKRRTNSIVCTYSSDWLKAYLGITDHYHTYSNCWLLIWRLWKKEKIHAVSDYKKRSYKKRIEKIKKRPLVRISQLRNDIFFSFKIKRKI